MILVSGASGRCGSAVVRNLLNAGQRVRLITRFPERKCIQEFRRRGAEVRKADMLRPDSLEGIFDRIRTALLISTPANGYAAEVKAGCNFISAAKRKVERIVFQSVIYAESRMPHCQTKGKIEAFLKNESDAYSILRPGIFTDAIPFRQIMSAQPTRFSTTGIAPDVPLDWIKVDSLAAATVAALTMPHPPNTVWDVTHPTRASWQDIAVLISDILNCNVDYHPSSGTVRDIVSGHSRMMQMPAGTAEQFLREIDFADEQYFAPVSERDSWCDPVPMLKQFQLQFPPLITWLREEAAQAVGHEKKESRNGHAADSFSSQNLPV